MVEVVWTADAEKQLEEIINYILKDSIQNAEKVLMEIMKSSKALSSFPERHPLDKYKGDSNDKIRAYEIYSYRIAYEVTPELISVIRIRSSRMEPKEY